MSLRSRLELRAAVLVTALLCACRLDETAAPIQPLAAFSLADATLAVPEEELPGAVKEQIAGALEMLFGTPRQPKLMRLPEWAEVYDPNHPQRPAEAGGGGEFDAAALAELHADNARVFRSRLDLVEAGRYDEVGAPDGCADLAANFERLLAATPPDRRDDEFKAAARREFVEYYPSLSNSAATYATTCLHCHGPEGGGNGPTARFLKPRPRDYRLGLFKFTAVGRSVPRRADLFRILDEGVTGTAMPNFRRLARAQVHGLIDYVRLLSMRGMVERDLAYTYINEGALTAADASASYAAVWEKWNRAKERVLTFDGAIPAPTPDSIALGRALFLDATKGNCFSCHGPEGRGDGVAAFVTDPQTGELLPNYRDDWGNVIVPRNLRLGVFHGGRRPIDLYRRIRNGIPGTPMPAASSALTSDDVWALVHFVETLAARAAGPAATPAPPLSAPEQAAAGGQPAGR